MASRGPSSPASWNRLRVAFVFVPAGGPAHLSLPPGWVRFAARLRISPVTPDPDGQDLASASPDEDRVVHKGDTAF